MAHSILDLQQQQLLLLHVNPGELGGLKVSTTHHRRSHQFRSEGYNLGEWAQRQTPVNLITMTSFSAYGQKQTPLPQTMMMTEGSGDVQNVINH